MDKPQTTLDPQLRLITVCDNCLCASCWHGEFMCDNAVMAGTTKKTIAELSKLGLESPEYWEPS